MRLVGHSFVLSIGILCLLDTCSCYAQWVKGIKCPEGTVYVDLRPDAGRQEFCERFLPGSLRVKDGPFRFWFSEGYPGDEGNYRGGRQVGSWKECSRFGQCHRLDFALVFPEEQKRTGFRQEIPVSYRQGKYIFDFASCWSTWVTQSGTEDLDLNINGSGYRCQVSYLPRHVTEHGGEGSYICFVPFAVGKRELSSLDLMHELPKLGLPQFCRPDRRTPEVLMIVDNKFRDLATSVDVQCAALEHNANGEESLSFRLNQYASDLTNDAIRKNDRLSTRLCFGSTGPNVDQPTQMVQDSFGKVLFLYRLHTDTGKARQQKECIAQAFDLKPSCR